MDFHFLCRVSTPLIAHQKLTDHLESIEFFLDLLGQHRRQTVASSYFPSSIIFHAWPSVMELDARTEADVSADGLGRARHTSRRSIVVGVVLNRQEIFFSLNMYRIRLAMPSQSMLVYRRARGAGVGRVIDSRNVREIKTWRSRFGCSGLRGRIPRIRSCTWHQ